MSTNPPMFKNEPSTDVYVVEYTEEYAKRVIGVSDEEIAKYGLPKALKYEGCDVLIPIPSLKSTKSSMRKLVKTKSKDSPEKNKTDISNDISDDLASTYFK